MGLWELFNKPPQTIIRDSTYVVEDDVGRFPVNAEYALAGLEEGWLEITHYRIDYLECEHYTLRLV